MRRQLFQRIPKRSYHIRFTKHDEYFRYDENDETVTFGISDFAQKQLGDIVFVDLPTVGQQFGVNDQVAAVESVKAASDINIPVEGVVTEINSELENDPSIINKDAHSEGWFFKFTPNSIDDIENNSMDEDTYLASKKD